MRYIRWLIFPWAWPLWWVIQAAIKIPTAVLGLAVTPLLYRYRYRHISQMPWWSKPWVNPEDWTGGTMDYTGSLPTWWIKRRGGETLWDFYKYHAIRNPADGLRNFEKLNLQINPEKIEFVGNNGTGRYDPWANGPGFYWYLCWQGIWAGFKVQWVREKTYTEFKIGSRIEPRDTTVGPDPDGSRVLHGASFASKFIPNREWK